MFWSKAAAILFLFNVDAVIVAQLRGRCRSGNYCCACGRGRHRRPRSSGRIGNTLMNSATPKEDYTARARLFAGNRMNHLDDCHDLELDEAWVKRRGSRKYPRGYSAPRRGRDAGKGPSRNKRIVFGDEAPARQGAPTKAYSAVCRGGATKPGGMDRQRRW